VKRLVVVGAVVCLGVSISVGQASPAALSSKSSDIAARIAGLAMTNNRALKFLETLADSVGARVTGSPQSRAASELILNELKKAGYDTAHFEEYTFQPRWERGAAAARITSPVSRSLSVGSYAWVPGTSGSIEVPLADLGSPPASNLSISGEKFRGAAVLVDVHAVGNEPLQVMRTRVAQQLARSGAAAMLIPSDKPDRMVYTSAWGFYPGGPLPVLSVGKEDTLLLRRLASKGAVKIALNIQNSFDSAVATERNVAADLPGTNPNEIVLVGGHFDSWDFAQGADDNGSGVAAILEAARILKLLNITPGCTIRFVFFSGEEQANLGSRAYIKEHKNELDHLRAFLMMDEGAQVPLGFRAQGREDLVAPLQELFRPLASLGANRAFNEADLESDNASFMTAGVPTLTLKVEPGDYDSRHHAITDTFDKVDPRALAMDTAAMAVAAYLVAERGEPLGRRLSMAEVNEFLKKSGLQTAQEVQFGPLEP
jgi:carboxypeptidase Q